MFKHLQKAKIAFWPHFRFSMSLSLTFAKASAAAIVHAVYPDILVSHSRDTLKALQKKFDERQND